MRNLIDRLRSRRRVLMTSSVAGDGFDLEAGKSYSLSPELADRMIIRGYAEGELSRAHSADEVAGIHAGHQRVWL